MPNFELVRDIINVLLTCKNEEDPIKTEGARVLTRLYIVFFRRSRAAYTEVNGGILPKFKLIQAIYIIIMIVLVTSKNEKDPIKNEGSKSASMIFPTIRLWDFFQTLNGS